MGAGLPRRKLARFLGVLFCRLWVAWVARPMILLVPVAICLFGRRAAGSSFQCAFESFSCQIVVS